jgi:DNA repair protein RadC
MAEAASPHYVGHRQRLRDKLIASKQGTLPDYEVMEILLGLALPRRDTKPLAKNLITRFGSFSKVVASSPELLKQVEGVSESVIATMRLAQEIGIRMVREQVMTQPILSSWMALLDYCRATMGHITTEQFRVLYLDKKNMVMADELQESGTVDQVVVYPREILKRALLHDASAVLLVHNHPSGNVTPSKADIELTKIIIHTLATISITVHDHVIIGPRGHYSFKSNGLF